MDTPAVGQASADGEPIMDIAGFMREQSTLIPQQAETFAGTVGENLLLGSSATTTAIQTALNIASADTFYPMPARPAWAFA